MGFRVVVRQTFPVSHVARGASRNPLYGLGTDLCWHPSWLVFLYAHARTPDLWSIDVHRGVGFQCGPRGPRRPFQAPACGRGHEVSPAGKKEKKEFRRARFLREVVELILTPPTGFCLEVPNPGVEAVRAVVFRAAHTNLAFLVTVISGKPGGGTPVCHCYYQGGSTKDLAARFGSTLTPEPAGGVLVSRSINLMLGVFRLLGGDSPIR